MSDYTHNQIIALEKRIEKLELAVQSLLSMVQRLNDKLDDQWDD